MLSSDQFKFTPRTEILNKKDNSLTAVAFPVSEKSEARNYLLDRKIPEFKMQDIWFVQQAQSLNLYQTNIKIEC